ncbi:efflux RND transporter periplasmic adaptor subunit [Salegentibacter sediminis]|uniref:efflux RND transporter periplasmic adaptor subunit n=1 Tax=Salegentibacter sediminis TaxID=1930251 RepID=UPI0009BCD510|nr:efflux RND transporter periplasmic adaptor subunit [Salegentibacter sediminis]
MKTRILLTLGLAATLFISCGDNEKENIKEVAAIQVTTSTPVSASGGKLSVSGTVEAENNATLSTRMMGYINKVHVNIGDKVKKGQVLVSINNADLQAKRAQVNAGINEATVAFQNAKKDYERFQALFAENSASQKEVDDITANYEMAKARLESAKAMKNEIDAQFAYANIRAPFSGVVTNKFVENGDMANPGMPLIAIEAPGDFEIRASVPEASIGAVKTGEEVEVLIKSLDQALKGKVVEVSSSSSKTGGQFPVKIALEKTDLPVRSGMYATVQFPIETDEKTQGPVTVSKEAIITQGDLHGVYTVSQQNTAMLRWLRLGRSYGDRVEVLSGLSADEAYIISAEGKLYNGAKVKM